MSDATLTAIIVSIPPTLVAIGGLIQGIRNGQKSAVIIHKAEEIHTLTNSNLTKVTADLALALRRIETLESYIAGKETS